MHAGGWGGQFHIQLVKAYTVEDKTALERKPKKNQSGNDRKTGWQKKYAWMNRIANQQKTQLHKLLHSKNKALEGKRVKDERGEPYMYMRPLA